LLLSGKKIKRPFIFLRGAAQRQPRGEIKRRDAEAQRRKMDAARGNFWRLECREALSEMGDLAGRGEFSGRAQVDGFIARLSRQALWKPV
jgi:hypothetical protein